MENDNWIADLTAHSDDALPAEVDVIVVGAGSGGCTTAGRLAADTDLQVLLLEAGTALPSEGTQTPGSAFFSLTPDVLDPNPTVPQPHVGSRVMTVPTGRGLGGGSTVNLFAWFRGHPHDYETWGRAGATGWGWEDVEPFFRRIESHAGSTAGDNPEKRGVTGPMKVRTAPDLELGQAAFIAAAQQAGIPVTNDLNGRQPLGAGLIDATISDGVRHSVLDGYLRPASAADNLQIRLNAEVATVDLTDGRATGVVLADGRHVRARTSVVLSAGAVRTPGILMRSGIGPAPQLRTAGIDTAVDLPGVGQNLHDHPMVIPVWPITSGRTLLDMNDGPATNAYRALRRGPLGNLPTTGAVLPGASGSNLPEIQALVYLLGIGGDMTPLEDPAISVTVALLSPQSRGSVRLDPDDPLGELVVDPGYLSDPDDLPRLRAGLRRIREIMEEPRCVRSAVHHSSRTPTWMTRAWTSGSSTIFRRSGTPSEPAAWARTAMPSLIHGSGCAESPVC